MAFGKGFLLGTAVGAIATLLYTPLEGRDARAILLGPFGWREVETEPEVVWTPRPTGEETTPAAT
jgi:gas vesicle protein